jgi:hypothetical protein
LALLACGGGASSTPQPAPGAARPNIVQLENALGRGQGASSGWILSAPLVPGHLIEGYASAPSVERGGSIDIFVNTTDPAFDLSIYRIGWYGGAGGRLLLGPVHLAGELQPPPHVDPTTGMVECDWKDPYELTIPALAVTDWASGVYLAKLVGSSGAQSDVVFVVRDDARRSDFLFQSSVTTFEAYNDWGGRSLYRTANAPAATKVSFNRPYKDWLGTGEFLKYEVDMVRFLEREGMDVSYTTDVDVDANPAQLLNHKAFLSVGHDEYWTKHERDALEAARDAGVHLGFFGSNTGYWQVRLEPSPISGAARRTLTGYKEACANDPMLAVDPSVATCRWRDPPVSRPEAALVGVMYDYAPVDADIRIAECPLWLCAGTALGTGSVLAGLLGREADKVAASSPPGITLVGASPYTDAAGRERIADMTFYTAASGAAVFAAGTMFWSWGLDDYGHSPELGNPDVQQMMRNLLRRFMQ